MEPMRKVEAIHARTTVSAEIRALMGRHRVTQTALADYLGMSQSALSERLNGSVPWNVDDLDGVAARIGVSRQTIGNYERGDVHTLKVLVLKAWAIACGVNPEWMIGDSTDSPNAHNPRYGNFALVTTKVLQPALFGHAPVCDQIVQLVK